MRTLSATTCAMLLASIAGRCLDCLRSSVAGCVHAIGGAGLDFVGMTVVMIIADDALHGLVKGLHLPLAVDAMSATMTASMFAWMQCKRWLRGAGWFEIDRLVRSRIEAGHVPGASPKTDTRAAGYFVEGPVA